MGTNGTMPIITKLAVDVDWDAELVALLASERLDSPLDDTVVGHIGFAHRQRSPHWARWALALLGVAAAAARRRR